MPWRAPTRLRSCVGADGGAVAVYVALVIPILVGAAGLAVDVTNWYATKRMMQTGADAAAYAAALEVARQGLDQAPDLDAVQEAADDAAGRNGVLNPVILNNPPASGLAAGDAASIEVIATQAAPVHFAGMFLGMAPTIMARAVAKAVVADACVWALHSSAMGALSVSGSSDVDLDCGVVVNSDHAEALDQGGTSCLSATSISVTGRYDGSCVSPEPEVEPSFGGCDHTAKITVASSESVTLTPGVYCKGISINGDVVLEMRFSDRGP